MRKNAIAVFAASAAAVLCASAVEVRDFGAVGDGIADDTAAIQRAIDAGGIVHFPPGVYLSGSLYLKSGGGLRLDDNAVLKGHPDISKWPIRPICVERSPFPQEGKVEAHLICCVDQSNVTVEGGIIDGNGAAFLGEGSFKKAGDRTFLRKADKYPGQLVWFNGCDSVRVANTTIRDSQYWTLMFHACNDVVVEGVRVYTRGDIMNADGIDIDCCNRVLVSGCFVDTGDDAIAVRAGLRGLRNPQPCENVVVTNCVLRSDYANAIRVGVGNGEIRHCRFSDIVLNHSRGGIHINPKFSDNSRGVAISDISFDHVSGEAMSFLYVTLDYIFSRKVTYAGVLENVRLSKVKGVSSLPLVFNGNTTGKLRRIAISDSEFRIRPFSHVPDSERKYFFASTNREDDRNLLQTNKVEDIVLDNVRIVREEPEAGESGGEPSATQPADVEIATVCAVTNRYHGWPTVARRSNGELLVAFSGDRRAHVCPHGKIQMVRSADDGRTWSAPETIYSSDTVDCRDAGIVELADGTLVLNFFTSIAYGRSGRKGYESMFKEKDKAKIAEELGYWSMRSTDGGKTWTDKVRMASSSPHNVIQLRDGRLAALGTRNIGWQWAYMPPEFASLGKELLFESSADGGKSWKSVVPVPVPSGVDAGLLYEPHVVELADGTLVGLVRYCVKPERSLQTESRDGGRTWTPLHENGANGTPPHLAHLADGRVLLTYAKRNGKTGGVYAAFSGDGTQTSWTGERLLFPWYQWDFGYPSSVQLGDGSVLTVFYAPEKAGGRCVIKSARWKPEMK